MAGIAGYLDFKPNVAGYSDFKPTVTGDNGHGTHLLLCVPSVLARHSLQAVTTHPSAGRNRDIADSFHVSAHAKAAGFDVFRATHSHISVDVRTLGTSLVKVFGGSYRYYTT